MFETAELLATWPFYDKKAERFILGPPMIPAQENFDPLTTLNPTFELEYFRFGIATAQDWRVRLGLPKNPKWDNVLFRLSKLPREGRHLSRRRVAAGSVGTRAFAAMLEGQHGGSLPEPRPSLVRRRATDCCRAGAPIARPCAAP